MSLSLLKKEYTLESLFGNQKVVHTVNCIQQHSKDIIQLFQGKLKSKSLSKISPYLRPKTVYGKDPDNSYKSNNLVDDEQLEETM